MSRAVMIMAGGTGGHVFPALAIAGELSRVREIVWLATERGIEARLVPAAGYPTEWIEVEGLRGKGLGRWGCARTGRLTVRLPSSPKPNMDNNLRRSGCGSAAAGFNAG